MPRDRATYNEYMRKYMLARYHTRRAEWIIQLGGKCIDCGTAEGLEFDHDDASSKAYDLAKIFSYSNERIQVELAKCVLRCDPCHKAKTKRAKDHRGGANRLPDEAYEHGTARMYLYKKCRCTDCRKANAMYKTKQIAIDMRITRPGS